MRRGRSAAAREEPTLMKLRLCYPAQTQRENRTGDQSGDDGDQRFDANPGDGEVFKALALANEIGTACGDGTQKSTIAEPSRGCVLRGIE